MTNLILHHNLLSASTQIRFLVLISLLAICNLVIGQYSPVDYTQKPRLLESLDSESQILNPILSAKGDCMWFTKYSTTNGEGNQAIQEVWTLEKTKKGWSGIEVKLKGLNTEKHNVIIGQSNGEIVYTINYNQGGQRELSTINAYKVSADSYALDHTITIPRLALRSEFFGFHMSDDETAILVSMNGEFSFGKEDLYVIRKINGEWQEPQHLGARVNTTGYEMSPYLASDGRHLFFASEGHNSYGSADIFVSVRLDDTWKNWSKPINLGPNINSDQFEAYFVTSAESTEAVFLSTRENNTSRLYSIYYNQSTELSSQSHNAASGFIRMEKLPAMNVKLNLLDENDQIIESILTNEDGYFNLQSFLPDRDYKIAIDDSIRQDLSTADIFLTNDLGDKMVYMNQSELGLFGFKVLSGSKIEEIEKLEQLASKGEIVDSPTTISGKVASYGTLNEKVKLSLVDENSNVLKEIETDENGYFQFSTDAKERSYFLSLNESSEGLVDVYEIFLTNDNPGEDIVVSKTDKHLFEFRSLSDGSKTGMNRLVEHDVALPNTYFDKYGYQPARKSDALAGYLRLGKLPLIDTEIELIDDRDMPLERTVTDDEGKFVFEGTLPEGDYALQLTPGQQNDLSNAEIYLANNPQDVVIYLNDDRNGLFAFKKLSKSRPMTLYSLQEETERGYIVSEREAKIRGKFSYDKLPKKGVRLRLMDENDNVVQVTEVKDDGSFEFEKYTVNKNYFISVENGDGLSDIYEIYLGGEKRNVLVNRTDRFVFAFKILPSQAILLSKCYEIDSQLGTKMRIADDDGTSEMKSYYEYNLQDFYSGNTDILDSFIEGMATGLNPKIRITQGVYESGIYNSESIEPSELNPLLEYLMQKGLTTSELRLDHSASDQVIISN